MEPSGRKLWAIAAAVVALIAALVPLAAAPPAQAASKLPAPEWPRVVRSGAHALKVRWEPVEGARSYAVYRYDKAKRKWRRAKVTRKAQWRDTGRKADVTYRYRVAACRKANGGGAGRRSYAVAARAYSRGAKRVNPAKPKVAKAEAKIALAAYDSSCAATGNVRVNPSGYGKKIGAKGCKAFSESTRYRSSDPKMIRVTRNNFGTSHFQALSCGACRVWAIAANGARSRPVEVAVVDATRPARFTDPGFADPEVVAWLNDEADAMSRVIKRCLKTGFWGDAWLDSEGRLACSKFGYDIAQKKALAKLKADKGLLADVMELLEHDVDGFRVEHIIVSDRITLHFVSDVIEYDRYEIQYTPENKGAASDWLRVAPYWRDVYCDPIY